MQIVKHIVLTGASGYVGKHLLHSFMSSKDTGGTAPYQYHVYALYRSDPKFQESIAALNSKGSGTMITVFSLDLQDSDAVDRWLQNEMGPVKRVDACIHLAALSNPGKCQADPDSAMAINVPKHFFTALQKQKQCQSFIALSTDHVYPGTHPPYKEDGGESLTPINVYGSTKYKMEKFLLSLTRNTDIPCRSILLRSSIILGPSPPGMESKSTFLHFIASRKEQETTFWTDEKRNVIWVGDVVKVIRFFVDHEDNVVRSGEIYNTGGPDSVSRFDMAKAVFDYFSYDDKYLIPQEKGQERAQNPSAGSPSPLDISMDTKKLQASTRLQFTRLNDIIKFTFAEAKI